MGTAVASWECGACATAPVINGALAGKLSLGATGGLSAARNGGDIRKGVLFGTVTGSVVGGLSGGTLDKFGLLNPAGSVILPSFGNSGPFVAGTAISGALLGAGKGATEAYAGGRGNFESIIRGAAQSAITGSITSPFTTYVGTLLSWQFLGGGMPKTPYSNYSLTWNAPDGNGLGELAPLAITLPRGLTNSVGEAGLIVGISELRR